MIPSWIAFETWSAWLLFAIAAAVATTMIATGMMDELVQIVRGSTDRIKRRS